MTLQKRVLAAAIVGGLFAANAQAQVNLSAVGGSVPVTFASELIVPGLGLTLTNATNVLDLQSNLRYNFSNGEVRHVRIECLPHIRFSAAANADSTFTGAALNRVYLSTTVDCSVVTTPASVITASTARFSTGPAAVSGTLCYAPRTGVAIPASTYAITFRAVSAAPTLYSVRSVSPPSLGAITRNGTELQAPLVQIPGGWLSRVVLTSTGSAARPFTIAAQTEAGVTATLGSAAIGSVPANGNVVLNVADIVTFTGGTPRGTLNVTVAGPTGEIQGLYQIVNPASGSASNHVMVRPASN